MTIRNMIYKKTLIAVLLSAGLAACGESDLVDLKARQLDDARQAAQSVELGAANPDEVDTGDGTDSGADVVDNGDATDSGDGADVVDTGNGTDPGDGADVVDTGDGADPGDGTDPVPGAGTGMDLSNYELVFNDEFRDTAIDASKWNTALNWGPDVPIYQQMQYYIDLQSDPEFGYNPFNLNGEILTITAIETPDALRAAANEQAWLSGVLTTAEKFDFTYGYVETRVDVNEGRGVWPAFWMLSSEFEDLKPELYIMEYNGSKPDSLFHNYNYEDADGNLRSPGQWEVTSDNFSEGFRKVGVAWSPGELLFYIDDQPRYRIVGENVSDQDMYLILNLAIGGNWPGAPDGTTPTPASIAVDYVRVYQLSAE